MDSLLRREGIGKGKREGAKLCELRVKKRGKGSEMIKGEQHEVVKGDTWW